MWWLTSIPDMPRCVLRLTSSWLADKHGCPLETRRAKISSKSPLFVPYLKGISLQEVDRSELRVREVPDWTFVHIYLGNWY